MEKVLFNAAANAAKQITTAMPAKLTATQTTSIVAGLFFSTLTISAGVAGIAYAVKAYGADEQSAWKKEAKEIKDDAMLYQEIVNEKDTAKREVFRDEVKARVALTFDRRALVDKMKELEETVDRTLEQEEEYQILKVESEAYDALGSFKQEIREENDVQLETIHEGLDKEIRDHNSSYNFDSLRKYTIVFNEMLTREAAARLKIGELCQTIVGLQMKTDKHEEDIMRASSLTKVLQTRLNKATVDQLNKAKKKVNEQVELTPASAFFIAQTTEALNNKA